VIWKGGTSRPDRRHLQKWFEMPTPFVYTIPENPDRMNRQIAHKKCFLNNIMCHDGDAP
jgi:hypothetical protein